MTGKAQSPIVDSHVRQTISDTNEAERKWRRVSSYLGQPFFYMAFACCVNVYMVSVHTSSM